MVQEGSYSAYTVPCAYETKNLNALGGDQGTIKFRLIVILQKLEFLLALICIHMKVA